MSYIDETGLAEVTTKLKTYIDNKASGGGCQAVSLQEYLTQCLTPTTNTETYTQNAVTLYTPNAQCLKYFIRKNT